MRGLDLNPCTKHYIYVRIKYKIYKVHLLPFKLIIERSPQQTHIQIQRFQQDSRKAEYNIQESWAYSSASSSAIVSNTGEMGTLVGGEMRRAGATSIQELNFLIISFAINCSKRNEMKRVWVSEFLPLLQPSAKSCFRTFLGGWIGLLIAVEVSGLQVKLVDNGPVFLQR